jgi:hypothetical protein
MQQEAPDIYEKYMENTPMFLPGEPGGRIYQLLLGRIKPKWLGLLTAYLLAIIVSMAIALGIRAYTVNQLPIVKEDATTLLSVFPRPATEITELYRTLKSSQAISDDLRELQPNLAYIFPGDFFLTAIVTDEDRRFSEDIIERFPEVLEWHQHKFKGGIGKFFRIFYNFFKNLGTVETNYDVERIVFVRVTDHSGNLTSPQDIFDLGKQRSAVMVVDLDSYDHQVLSVIKTSGRHKWGSMPMPTF